MPKFSAASEAQLATCDERLQRVARAAILVVDFAVVQGHRGEAEQNKAYDEGKSKKRWPDSTHNPQPSRALDFVPASPVTWIDRERFAYVAGVIVATGAAMGIPLRWGGDWDRDGQIRDESFVDMPHIELV